MTTPNDLPSVGTEDAIVRHYTEQVMQVVNDVPMDAARTQWGVDACEMLRDLVAERDELASRVRELEGERDAAAKRAPDFAEFVDETDSTLEMVKRTFGTRGSPPKMLEAFATITMVEQLLKQCEQARAALSATTPESKP